MAEVKGDLLYTKEHEWVSITGVVARIGITDYAQGALGDVTYVDFPAVDGEYKQEDVIANVESVKAASDIYAPLSGKVTAVNTELESRPELLNTQPYEGGWVCEMEISNPDEQEALLSAEEYKEFLKTL
jgi:glycine cleavage system H protein